MPGLFFNKVAGPGTATLLKKRLWHRCFPVNYAKFLRKLFYRTPPVAASVSSSKNMPVDLREGLLFDTSIVESGQLTFNHSFNLFFLISNISSTEILLSQPV